jgi:hypothetical protein
MASSDYSNSDNKDMAALKFLFKDLDKIGSRKQYFGGFATTDAVALH